MKKTILTLIVAGFVFGFASPDQVNINSSSSESGFTTQELHRGGN
ncbi:hypothetical protein P4637_08370 [Halalkalibacterium halodurans]|jgi:hypothetical protein|nr:hypothetical protein [Halalkalibacterium halodurans]MED4081084.1 hypothetical protein [Halalkalibacterium halodurans]MED4084852.1 hypothetical protein [Halalkalibacterium halodurans]MED4103444.1 hypothetical protein [Halalkalibacterium halodurans]MED4107780.1 hypothetical protein [Halalkalibacterium halodurans]MED4123820.1 hypothetical protein [Halalkalibacterium halodurans]